MTAPITFIIPFNKVKALLNEHVKEKHNVEIDDWWISEKGVMVITKEKE